MAGKKKRRPHEECRPASPRETQCSASGCDHVAQGPVWNTRDGRPWCRDCRPYTDMQENCSHSLSTPGRLCPWCSKPMPLT